MFFLKEIALSLFFLTVVPEISFAEECQNLPSNVEVAVIEAQNKKISPKIDHKLKIVFDGFHKDKKASERQTLAMPIHESLWTPVGQWPAIFRREFVWTGDPVFINVISPIILKEYIEISTRGKIRFVFESQKTLEKLNLYDQQKGFFTDQKVNPVLSKIPLDINNGKLSNCFGGRRISGRSRTNAVIDYISAEEYSRQWPVVANIIKETK